MQVSKISKASKIAIIGAGPGGLSAAEALKELGYHEITVIEKLNRPGGMSLSFSYPAEKGNEVIYELGSLQPTYSKYFHALIKKNNLHIGKNNTSDKEDEVKIKMYSLKEHRAIVDFKKYHFGFPFKQLIQALPQGLRFFYYLLKYYRLNQPGYDQIGQEHLTKLSIGYEEWLTEKNFKSIDVVLRMLGSIATFSNPSSRQFVPLVANIKVFLNLMGPPTTYINGTLRYFKEGYQELWNRVAKNHDVIFNAKISKVERNEKNVKIFLENKVLEFDKLIVTCSLTEALTFLDASAEENLLFSKVHYAPGWRAAFLAKNMPHDALYALIDPYLDNPTATPSIQSFYPEGQIDEQTWLYSSMFNLNKDEDIKPLLEKADTLLKSEFGATEIKWLNSCYWPDYVPYFLGQDIKEGIFQKLERLQGQHHTYFLGGTLSGSAQAVVVDYSYDRIKKFFG